MAFRNRKTLKKNKYAKKTAKRRTWKGAAPPPRRIQSPPPVFMEPDPRSPTGHSVPMGPIGHSVPMGPIGHSVPMGPTGHSVPMGNLSPIRVSTHTPTLSDVEDSFSLTPPASPNRSRSRSRSRQ